MKQLTVCVIATSVSINNYPSLTGLIGHTGIISSTPVRTVLDLSGPFKNYNYPYRPIRNLMAPSGFSTFLDQSGPLRKCQDLCFTLLRYQYPFQVHQGLSISLYCFPCQTTRTTRPSKLLVELKRLQQCFLFHILLHIQHSSSNHKF